MYVVVSFLNLVEALSGFSASCDSGRCLFATDHLVELQLISGATNEVIGSSREVKTLGKVGHE